MFVLYFDVDTYMNLSLPYNATEVYIHVWIFILFEAAQYRQF
jgi:hypothetical protein